MKKVVILVDGQNLYYSLLGMKLIEKDIHWKNFFNSLIDPEDELIRSYWFRPQKIQDNFFSSDNIRSSEYYKKYRNYFQNYKNGEMDKIPEGIVQTVEKQVTFVEEWIKKQKDRFSQIEYAYDQLSIEYNDIEIIKTGIVKIKPQEQVYIGEKGVDIALAVKMIALSVEKKCDKIILVSGDYDYMEAIKFVKNNMTKLHVVKFHKGTPPRNKNMSRDISVMADKLIDIYETDMKNKFLKNPANEVELTTGGKVYPSH
ncbi:NYN domain-containing protein [Dyadobacter aurulentus]|uniref:NYN domain-containing protein n=1 Tax=Dyadobacter sp. UC 10 TaxID=2605428 RepID=UPI0011F325F2|nr:NYN domain-containing protein [Dyadobacter sp. UC 10]KAA0990803.1 NYN domain-containing protein [Dyadobacter sp. UC 10]